MEARVVLAEDEAGLVEGLHGQMQGRRIQELLCLMLAIGLSVIEAYEAVLVRLTRVVALVTMVIVGWRISVGFAQEGVLELTEALHGGVLTRQINPNVLEV